jgi:hypothetical protein
MIAMALVVDFFLFAPMLMAVDRRDEDENTSLPAHAA